MLFITMILNLRGKPVPSIPPFAAIIAAHLSSIEATKVSRKVLLIFYHSSRMTASNVSKLEPFTARLFTQSFRYPHICSIGFRSALFGGHASKPSTIVFIFFILLRIFPCMNWSIILLINEVMIVHFGMIFHPKDGVIASIVTYLSWLVVPYIRTNGPKLLAWKQSHIHH